MTLHIVNMSILKMRGFLISIKSLLISLVISFSLPTEARQPDSECVAWFKESNILTDSKSCNLACKTIKVDMGTFICPDQCDLLCQEKTKNSLLASILYYPGLTPAERALTEKYPKEAISVFIQKTRAESSTERIFPDQGISDESDALRHFIWAGLLTKELGAKMAQEFLIAHESDPSQPTQDYEMDIHNNSKGQQATEKLIKEKSWSLQRLEEEGQKRVESQPT